jgi:hypothetical protein
MEHTEIQRRVNDLSQAMQSKGLRQPEATARFESNAQFSIMLRWKDVTKARASYCDAEYHWIREDEPAVAFEKAVAFIDQLPSADEARMKQFMGALANVIDLGKDNGIEVEFLNPLQATMKKLSDNILTDQRAA